MDLQAGGFRHGPDEGNCRAFAVCPGDMDRRRQIQMRIAECLEDSQEPVQRQDAVIPGFEPFQPFERRLNGARSLDQAFLPLLDFSAGTSAEGALTGPTLA